jgi:hypothetical protein
VGNRYSIVIEIMRCMLAFIISLACELPCKADAPRSVAGLMLRETRNPNGHEFNYTLTQLREDGAAVGLWVQTFVDTQPTPKIILPVAGEAAIPAIANWSYAVTGKNEALLTIGARVLRLNFSDESGMTGSYSRVAGNFSGRFLFTAYEESRGIVNSATRAFVAPGRSVSGGFVIKDTEKRLLVRAIGPGLRAFGVTDILERVELRLGFARNANWTSTMQLVADASHRAGAFPLAPENADAAVVVSLQPGAYTFQVSSPDPQGSGEILVEVYELP